MVPCEERRRIGIIGGWGVGGGEREQEAETKYGVCKLQVTSWRPR